MIKTMLLVSTILFAVSGCSDPQPQENWIQRAEKLSNVKGLEDCTFYEIKPDANKTPIKLVRCPNSMTANEQLEGKVTVQQITIDSKPRTCSIVKQAQLEALVQEQAETIQLYQSVFDTVQKLKENK